MLSRDEAWNILKAHTKNESLIKHALSVEAAMRYYAHLWDQNLDLWGIVGLLHDFDYEQFSDPPQHTQAGAAILRERGVEEEIVGAILSHADWNLSEYPRDTLLRKTLFAVDELCGFIIAVALVRPDRLSGLQPSSVKKKLKQRTFAEAVNRNDIRAGAELLGLDLEDHIRNCITALQGIQGSLGLT